MIHKLYLLLKRETVDGQTILFAMNMKFSYCLLLVCAVEILKVFLQNGRTL